MEDPSIPRALLKRLQAVRPALEVNACVQPCAPSRLDGLWRLRYHETTETGRRHRSVQLGGSEMAMAVKSLIDGWREEREREEERIQADAKRVEEAEKRKKRELSGLRRLAIALGGGGQRRRRRTAKAFDEAAAKGVVGLYAYAMEERWNRPDPRGGRPSASGLW